HILLLDTATGERRRLLFADGDDVRCLAFSADGRTLASGDRSGRIRLWDVRSGRERVPLPGHDTNVRAVLPAPDGTFLASAGADNTVCVWGWADRREVLRSPHRDIPSALAFAPGGRFLAWAVDERIHLWTGGARAPRVLPRK